MKQKPLEGMIENNLVSGRDKIAVSPDLDRMVMGSSSSIRPYPSLPFSVRIVLIALFTTLMGSQVFVVSHRMNRITSKECLKTYSGMTAALNQKDVDKAVGFFDLQGMGTDEKRLKKAMTSLYDQFDRVEYVARDIVVTPGPKGAVTSSHFTITMRSSDGRTIITSGKDRIWFTKTQQGLKILYRMTEGEKTI